MTNEELEQVTLLVPATLAQAVVNYLQTKPFGEVHQLISALVQCKPSPTQGELQVPLGKSIAAELRPNGALSAS